MSGLAPLGIVLRDHCHPGEHRAGCPHCAMLKPRPGDDALAVRVESDGSATWLCHRCGWKGALAADRQYHEHRPRARPAAPEPDRAATLRAALALWNSAKPIAADTLAGRYLAGRGCALPHPDADLRFVERHRHPSGHVGPALVALVTYAETGKPLTVHRTWIAPDGSGKAPIERPRLLWPGLPSRGVVRLCDDADAMLGLCVGEGLKTVLTAARGFTPAWACLDAWHLKTLPVLAGLDCLTIVADHDAPNPQTGIRAGEDAVINCARRWLAAGVEVRIWADRRVGVDFADYAQELVGSAAA